VRRLRLARARRGFTLLEVMIYCALVTVGLATFIAVEVSARKSTALQGAILDVEEQSRRYLGAWRQDVEAAKRVTLKRSAKGAAPTPAEPDQVEIVRLDGSKVQYTLGKRVELDAKGAKVGEDRYAHLRTLSFKLDKGQVEASLSARRSLGQNSLTRTYRRVATPRAASAVLEAAK
jgi:Tfp pilus assembly protein PilE